MEKIMKKGILLEGVSKSYLSEERDVTPLKNISFRAEPGKITSILGKSGCGKTTLLHIISGLERLDSGEVKFFDEKGKVTNDVNLSLVFQEPRLLPWKTIRLALPIRYLNQTEQDRLIREALELVQLPGIESMYPENLSGGMAQRVGLARGLISKPDVLLLDEPFSSIDFMTRTQLQRDLSEIQRKKGFTTLLITHDINEAVFLSDEILCLEDGEITKKITIESPKPRDFGDVNLSIYQKQLFEYIIK